MAVKTELGWELMGGRKHNKKEGSCNNSISTIDQNVQNFWRLESYGTLPKLSSELCYHLTKKDL